MSTEMLLGHIALGVYSLALTLGIFVMHAAAAKIDRFHQVALWILMAAEIAGLVCLVFHFVWT
jgi:hypothetical protein